MKAQFPDFTTANVLVVGDLMLDRYWYGNTRRISPEAPVPVVHVGQQDACLGGSGNVALNLAALGAKTSLVAMVGDDDGANIIEDKLAIAKISSYLDRIPNKPTITKLRVLSQNQQLIRMDFEQDFSQVESSLLLDKYFQALAAGAQVVIISDYGKGTLRDTQAMITEARKQKIPVLVDPKGNDFQRYQGATIITPNLHEFEQVVGTCATESELIEKGLRLVDDLNLEALLITRGAQGLTLLRQGLPELHLPARALEIYDVTGAGDTVIAVLAAALAAKLDITMAIALANRAAGIVVGKLGTASISGAELYRSILQDQEFDQGIMSKEQLIVAVNYAKALGEKIIMTNGCFDILHAGHVSYLEKAKALGQRLIIAVNNDASVSRLKGPARPINSIGRRMSVLAGLAAVDWIVPFGEDTPENLIKEILPDVLVKGGDYKLEAIAGSDTVIDNGGEVRILSFEEGCSTTMILEKLKKLEVEL